MLESLNANKCRNNIDCLFTFNTFNDSNANVSNIIYDTGKCKSNHYYILVVLIKKRNIC